MAVTLYQKNAYVSRVAAQKRQQRSAVVHYFGIGLDTDDDQDVIDAINGQTPPNWGTNLELERGTIGIELTAVIPDHASSYWEVSVNYVHPENKNSEEEQEHDDSEPDQLSFDTSGGTKHIETSLSTATTEPSTGVPDHKQAILVKDGIAQGVDIISPAFKLRLTRVLLDSAITDAYVRTLSELTGSINDAAFKGFQAEELLLEGVQGAQRNPRKNGGTWELTFNFTAGVAEQITVPPLNPVTPKPWQYAWVDYNKTTTGTPPNEKTSLVPIAIYVEDVYPKKDWSQLGIGTT